MKLVDLKTQALRYLALGEQDRALLCYVAVIRQVPQDLDARMKIADVLVQAGMQHLACRVYAALGWCDLQAGRPLHALVCSQALSDLGQSVASIHESLAELYGVGSGRLLRVEAGEGPEKGGSLVPPDPETEILHVDLQTLPRGVTFEVAAEVAADTETFSSFPASFPPIPLLSDLPAAAFARVSQAALIRRLGPRVTFIKEGSAGYSLFFVASGSAQIQRGGSERGGSEGPPQVLARISEGAIVGELALLGPRARMATVETCEPTDLIELPVRVLRTLSLESPAMAAAVDHFLADRLLLTLLRHSPLFNPFTVGQRLELLPRFVRYDVAAETILVREGEVSEGLYIVLSGSLEVLKGQEPFETLETHLLPGDLFGELSLLRQLPAPATVRAETQAVVLTLSHESFERLCHTVPEVRRELSSLSAEQLRELAHFSRSVWQAPLSPEAEEPLLLQSLLGLNRDKEASAGEFPFFV